MRDRSRGQSVLEKSLAIFISIMEGDRYVESQGLLIVSGHKCAINLHRGLQQC